MKTLLWLSRKCIWQVTIIKLEILSVLYESAPLFFKFKRRLCIQYTLLSGSLNTHMAGHGSKHICHVPGKNSCAVSIMCKV